MCPCQSTEKDLVRMNYQKRSNHIADAIIETSAKEFVFREDAEHSLGSQLACTEKRRVLKAGYLRRPAWNARAMCDL